MLKGRGLFTLAILVLIVLAVLLLLNRDRTSLNPFRSATEDLPLDLREVIPADWDLLEGKQKECDFDQDGEPEWLVVYRYDNTGVQAPYRTEGVTVSRGPIGAAVFDRQTNIVPQDQGNPSPYRPTMVIPYRLLPDFYAGKGQGYLGEAGSPDIEVIYYPTTASGDQCKVDEISVLGYADSKLPTRLSIFHWQDHKVGFRAAHFAGNARIAASISLDGSQTIHEVTTYNRLGNHRSLLCESRTYQREGEDKALLFKEKTSTFTVDFCFTTPRDPSYPEGVVVALLRGGQPAARSDSSRVPPTNGFLTQNAALAFQVNPQGAAAMQILSVTNPAGVSTDPAGGHECTAGEIKQADTRWVCGRESAVVETEIMLDGQARRAIWQLISIVPDQIDSDVFWRVERVDLP